MLHRLNVPFLARSSIQDLSRRTSDPDFEPTADQKVHYFAEGGNDIVHEIWSVLRDYEPTWKDSVTGLQPTSITGKVWYYTKVVLKALFMNSPTLTDNGTPRIRGDLKNAVETLEIGAAYGDADAIFLLADMNFYGNFSHPRNFQTAFKRYEQLANLTGNSTAQHMLGLMYATGIGGAVERDQAKSLLYHSFAAEQGEVRSEMTLGFRYHAGIGTGRDCNKAAEFYKRVADKAMDWWQSGPPGGHMLQRNAVRWVEFEGGAYGEGASVSTAGHLAIRDGSISPSFDDVLEFLDMRERQGDWNAVLTLGKHYYEAPRGYRRNLRKAQRQFMKIARAYWTKDGKINPKAPKGIEKNAGKAAAYLGRMHLRGEGVEQNFDKAAMWFRRGISNADALAQFHLGLMYREGLGVPKDSLKAASYFHAASEQDLAIAQSALGVLFLDQGDIETAHRYFQRAASAGVMEGFYYLAELNNKGVGQERNCALSVAYYKVVAEKAETLHSSFTEANAAYERGDLERAFVTAIMAAEQGYEHAQANVAFLLDQKSAMLPLSSIPLLASPLSAVASAGIRRTKLLTDPSLALVYFTRSAKQANVDSLIKMGDYYLSGSGTNITTSESSPSQPLHSKSADLQTSISADPEKASNCYTTAAESHHSAQALWNLGWMHENGIGPITQDFHMAKRYYDLALEMNKEAYLPVKLSLLKLRMRSWWNSVSGGKVNGIKDETENKKSPKTFMEWLNRFLDAAEEMDAAEYAELLRQQDPNRVHNDLDLGYGGDAMPGGDNDHYYHNGNEGGIDGDYLDGDIDDGLVESLIIVALAGALALLVYARQQRQRLGRDREDRERREREQGQGQNPGAGAGAGAGVAAPVEAAVNNDGAQQPGQGGGFFPQPGDIDFANWAVGGIGH